jgi:hypothetical protein
MNNPYTQRRYNPDVFTSASSRATPVPPAQPATNHRPQFTRRLSPLESVSKSGSGVRTAPSQRYRLTEWCAELNRETGRELQLLFRPRTSCYSRLSLLYNAIYVKFSLSPDPTTWGSNLSPDHPEADDYLHNPDPRRDRKNDHGGHLFTYRGLTNLGCMIVMCTGLLALL